MELLPLDRVFPNPDQPRKIFEAGALRELANNIAANGLLQPITVRPMPDGAYQIVAGERRYRAHMLLAEEGRLEPKVVPAQIKDMDEVTRDVAAILENLMRVDVTPLEEARAYQRVLAGGMTLEDLARKLGIAAFRITERTQLLNLKPVYLKMLEAGQLDRQQAFEISRLDREADQTRIVQLISRGQLKGWKAVRAAVDAVVNDLTQEDFFGDAAPKPTDEEVATVSRMEQRIEAVGRMVASGWKEGECVIASKVDPDRARLMADRLREMQKALLAMERELRMTQATADILTLDPAKAA